MKKCHRCGNIKPECDFHKEMATKDGLQKWCKQCQFDIKHLDKKLCPRCNKYRHTFEGDLCLACTRKLSYYN